jgi:SAM-dependent methyltransferase
VLVNTTVPWRCPTCESPADVAGRPALRFRCAQGHEFTELDGVLCLCEGAGYADSFGPQWLTYARTQVDKFNGTTISRDRFFEFTGWPQDLRGQTVLEAGSGSGRFTQVLLDAGAEVVSFDYSRAVVANHLNNGDHERLTLFRGDIYRIPVAAGFFDRVVCLGVLQHTPNPKRAFQSLVRMLKPGGLFAADIYRRGIAQLGSPKYTLRLFRRMLRPDQVQPAARRIVNRLLPAKKALRRIPMVGVPLAHMLIPVSDYRGRLPLTDEQAREWSELELVDAITPEHDHPASRRQLEAWCAETNLADVEIATVSKGGQYVVRARAPR